MRPGTTDTELDGLRTRLEPLFAKHHVLRAIVFGSFATGDVSRHSDLDLIVVLDTRKRFLDRYDDFLRPLAEAVPGRGVDVFIYTPQELKLLSSRPFIARALREGRTLYESSQEAA